MLEKILKLGAGCFVLPKGLKPHPPNPWAKEGRVTGQEVHDDWAVVGWGLWPHPAPGEVRREA